MPVKLAFYVVKKQFYQHIIYAIVIGIVTEILQEEYNKCFFPYLEFMQTPSMIILKMQLVADPCR